METTKDVKKFLDATIQVLRLLRKETPKILERRALKPMQRHVRTIEEHSDDVHNLKTKMQKLMIVEGEEPSKIREWSQETEDTVLQYERIIEELENNIKELHERATAEERQREQELEEEKRRRQFEHDIKLEEAKLQMKREIEKKLEEEREKYQGSKDQKLKAKLPKLEITKFQGTHVDWLRFWSQFEAEIDQAELGKVAKFSYLKELLVPKVRQTIDGLPFTTEGYERAKQILKTKYGKPSEVVNAHVQNLMSLQSVNGANPVKIHEFYEKLVTHVQILETMGKLNEIAGYVRITLDKLPGIRADLVRMDDDWQEWGFSQLIEALRKWCERNPVQSSGSKHDNCPNERSCNQQRRERIYQVKQREWKPRSCVYCEATDHRSSDCNKVTSVTERKKQLSLKKLCFNCTGGRHRAAECHSKATCQKCKGKHLTSICDKESNQVMLATGERTVTYPVVVVKVDGVKCRALLDTGAGSSYISTTLATKINKKPIRKEYRRIDMMMCSTNQRIDIYEVTVASLKGDFSLAVNTSKVDKEVLLSLPNPRYSEMMRKYRYMEGVSMDDVDTKPELPIHMILGASEYTKIKTDTKPRIGNPGEPVAEMTAFSWTIMSPGAESTLNNVYLTQSSTADYEKLCNLDVLGLADKPTGDQSSVYEDFKEQLTRNTEGWYETGLLWKNAHPNLDNNKSGSLGRLASLVRKLQRDPELFDEYDNIIQQQLEQGIIERVTADPKGREFYIPHKPLVRRLAESTKTRIVYDASAKGSEKSPSLNDCLETGPPLQNLMWNVLVRNRFMPVALTGDMKQAFLQVRIREDNRDALRFHWINDKDPSQVETFRFTRALFGLVQSPFLLGGTIEEHLKSCQDEYPLEVKEVAKSLYVDDVITGANTVQHLQHLKDSAIAIFDKVKFQLHKWHSNAPELEDGTATSDEEQTYAKQQFAIKSNDTKMLGLSWNKGKDTLSITFLEEKAQTTKRGILRFMASIYDPLGFASPITLQGKLLYRAACEEKMSWDEQLPDQVNKQWLKAEKNLPTSVEVPRSLAGFREEIEAIDLHLFGDTSGHGTAAVIYAVVYQQSGVTQGLVAARSQLAKKGLTIPRLELVSAHMAANLGQNVVDALEGLPVRNVYGWLDSTVALHWIKGQGNYKQFVANRVRKIADKKFIQWRYINTAENPADVASRGAAADKVDQSWWNRPTWLSKQDEWPEDKETTPNDDTEAEAKIIKQFLGASVNAESDYDQIINKHSFWKAVRMTCWIWRFLRNCRAAESTRLKGPLTTEETQGEIQEWVRREQHVVADTDAFKEDLMRLNLVKNADGIYECHGRFQGSYPIYLPPNRVFTEKLVMDAHLLTLHGGVGLTMAKVRSQYWIPRLRQLAKRTIRACHGCKRFQATALKSLQEGNLPTDRTVGSTAFQVIGVDYAGPLTYARGNCKTGKAYILLFSCSLTRAIYLELVPDQGVEEFIRSLKRFIARKGRPEKIYSDNGRTFIAASKWLKKITRDEQVSNYLARSNLKWQLNLSRGPWWGGQFERMVGLVKQSLYKSVGKANLKWEELQEVMLDIEIALNNRPLGYVEDDAQLPLLTPNALQFGLPNSLPEEDPDSLENVDLRKRARYLRRCKDALWSRWTKEYITALRERHNLKYKSKTPLLKVGDVVLVKSNSKNRAKWNIGIVEKLIKGRDGIIRAARLRAGKSYLERAIQHLYPLELSCNNWERPQQAQMNPAAREFRPRRTAAVDEEAIDDILMEDEEDEF